MQFLSQFYLWDTYIYTWGTIVMIPILIVSMIFFGGFDVGGGLFPYSNISDIVTYSIGILFWYIISCAIATGWNLLFESFGKSSKRYEKATIISLTTVFTVLVIIMPTIATSSIVVEKTTRQNVSMDELLYLNDLEELYFHPENSRQKTLDYKKLGLKIISFFLPHINFQILLLACMILREIYNGDIQ